MYETEVTESLWRLARVGDLAVDVGANIGYMTSILAVKAGARGKINSFEPHPTIFQRLRLNVKTGVPTGAAANSFYITPLWEIAKE